MLELPDMIKNDLHMHSFRSRCGQHDYFVLYKQAERQGMTSIAITDHGLDLGGMTTPSTFLDYKRTPAVMEGVRVFRGIESNLRTNGTTDVQRIYEKELDVVLLGLHGTGENKTEFQYLPPSDRSLLLPKGESESYYTDLLLKAIENEKIDALTHIYIKFPLSIDPIVEACKEKGIAIELNNASFKLDKVYKNKGKETIDAINKYAPRIVINSDTHCYIELGNIDAIRQFLKQYPIEADVDWVNKDLESTEVFVKERKELRQK